MNNEIHTAENNEAVDLLDMAVQLWRGKNTIIICIVLAFLLAVAYLFIAKEKWTSNAIVNMPDSGQIANYTNSMNVLYMQNPGSAPSVVDVQNRFFNRFNALISALSEELDNQDEPEKLTIEPTVKGQPAPLKISYTAKSAAEARKTLATYLEKINQRVISELDEDLNQSINSNIVSLKDSLNAQEKVASEKRDQRLAMLNQALIVAKASKIKSPAVQQAEFQSEDTLFLLGSDALQYTIDNEKSRPLPLSDYYYQTRQTLMAISALKSKPESLYSFRYVMKPSLPIHRDSPKRALTVVLSILLGGLIGAGIVLTRNSLRTYRARS
ncbi:LPS O-antigen chain length determinant protein WzzB [Franconibacter pulveris]|uniref:LPS O-antigen chain length determinant protein WzzB n=1 Tax=Franconibacter pulveris TaxID=435910 RepID=UPI0004954787|nr:LPS O-antigen chain length determinant protein WzzB [Franconibacter pulveris]